MCVLSIKKQRGLLVYYCGQTPFIDSISSNPRPVFGAVNGNVTFYASSSIYFPEILWKKNMDKVIEWEEYHGSRAFPPFVGRVHLNTISGDLTIFNLTSSDEDEYEVEFLGTADDIKFTLLVLDPLPIPTLNCTSTLEDIIVHCKIPESYKRHTNYTKYSWSCSSAQCINTSDPSEVLIKKNNDLSQKIQCIISNPLSKQISSLILATCVPPGNSRNRWAILVVVIIIAIVTVLLIKVYLKCGRETVTASSS
eukprot:XP_013976043.1 lymphocyte function-associated antigen 3 [Canis lupus familiaris]